MIATFNISQQGESHVISNTVCQDYSASKTVRLRHKRKLLSISAVADGVGSCQYSHYGSKTAVEEALQNIEKRLEATYPQGTDAMIALIRSSFALALEKIEECADSMKMPFPLFDTTLTIAVFDGNRVWYRTVSRRMRMMNEEGLSNDTRTVIEILRDRFLMGEIGLDEFITETDRRLKMEEMEGE